MSTKFTFHVLGLPHTVSSKEYNACAYTQKVVKFCKMMTEREHKVIHYGHEDSDLLCTEHVPVLTNSDFDKCYGSHDWKKQFFKYDVNDHAYQTFYANAIREIQLRKKRLDFILPFWGAGVRPICDAHPDLICVEPGIGYAGGHWAKWKVFESYAIFHAYCGLKDVANCTPRWYETVIPNYFDLDEFTFQEKKEDYFLYLGRVYSGKGVQIAIETCMKIGARLIIAGQGSLEGFKHVSMGPNIEHIGYADLETRKRLMAGAKGLFLPSQYIEPFGGVQVEALLSGTPTITTDWGAFTENNIHGITGFRCRTFNDFVTAARNIETINPRNCRAYGENFSLEKVAPLYEKYFTDVLNVHGKAGWYEVFDDPNFGKGRTIPSFPERCHFTNIAAEEMPQARAIASWVRKCLPSKTAADIGCGPAIYTEALREVGVDAVGYDIDVRSGEHPHVLPHDITQGPVTKADVVLCIEVAEHIPEERADAVVENVLASAAHTVVWTAAAVGQGGNGHVNCQPKEYWEKKFAERGAQRLSALEVSLKGEVAKGLHMGWFMNNLMIFAAPKP